ncbi:DUF2938 family protein [Elusimicrobiota bacterium]
MLGTIAMDLLNWLCAWPGLITKIDAKMIGRMAVGWTRGRFCYSHPSEMDPASSEFLIGLCTHYAIGLAFAAFYVLGWELLVGGAASAVGALVYGVGTTAASWFFVYPVMGLGIFGLRSPDGMKAAYSSLANHLFFGIGMAAAVAIVNTLVI